MSLTEADTGDRPYMCILCKDTFSRSDILKRHFQKCSIRRGNPTGASHLSNPAAHFRKSQNANANTQAKSNTPAKSNVGSPVSGANGSLLMPSANLRQNTRQANDPFASNSVNFSDAPTDPFLTATATPNGLHRPASNQIFGTQNAVGTASNGAWAPMQPAARSSNPAMYSSASASPHHFGLPASSTEERKSTLSAASGVGEEWNQMFQPNENQDYIFPSSMSGSYDAMHSHVDVKKEYGQGTTASNNYFIPPTNSGAAGTLGPLLWNLGSKEEDFLQSKSERLVDFCFPGGIQDSLHEQQSNANLRACLTADNIKHFLEQFSNFQGHFPVLHMASFNFHEAYDGLIMGIMCIGAVYSDRLSQRQVRDMMQRAKNGIEHTSLVFQEAQHGDDADNSQPRLSASLRWLEEIQAAVLLFILFTWHGGPAERAFARSDSAKLFRTVKRYHLLDLIRPGSEGYSYLHNLQFGEQGDLSHWNWVVWVNQEMRLRVLYLVFLYNSALVLYFNGEPYFKPSEIKLPLPCDDSGWDSTSPEQCASALGMHGPERQRTLNRTGSLREKQLTMNVAIKLLYSPTAGFQPRMTNVFSKFILVHALHIHIWQLHRQLSSGMPNFSESPTSPSALSPHDDGPYSIHDSRTTSGHGSPTESSLSGAARGSSSHPTERVRAITNALIKWKNTWDQDMQLQYPPLPDPSYTPRRQGFCRDGVHFYWLGRAFLQTNRISDWQLPAEMRFKQVISGLRQVREFSKSDAARRGEEPGSVNWIDHAFNLESLELDMRKLFCPIEDMADSPVESFSRYAVAIGV
jgi:Fungal specific transcription factor domain